jgi:transcriptional regulator with XRE-family HTH domain
MILGENIRAMRRARGISLPQLSAASGVSLETLTRLERGPLWVSVPRMESIAHALDVPLPALFEEPCNNEPNLFSENKLSRQQWHRRRERIALVLGGLLLGFCLGLGHLGCNTAPADRFTSTANTHLGEK